MKTELTFSQELKTKWINVMQEHQDMDRLVQGSWLDNESEEEIHRGCFFGCAMQTEDNALSKAIDAMNLPEWLVYLAEKVFEGLPKEQAVLFPVQLLTAIPVNADIKSLRHELAIKRLEALIKDSNGDEVNSAINLVIQYHKSPTESARSAAESAARSAAWSARSAAESAAESARSAWSAAESARSAAWSAAESARSAARSAWSAAESARSAAWIQERDWLIELLSDFNNGE